jgi:hypothetical protein
VADGMTLTDACRAVGLRAPSVFCDVLAEDSPRGKKLTEMYARARESRHEIRSDEMYAIADDGKNDWMESNDPDNPGYKLNGEHVQRSKLRVDLRKWELSKLAPRYKDAPFGPGTGGASAEAMQAWFDAVAARLPV